MSISKNSVIVPPSYPLIGSLPSILANQNRPIQWTSDILLASPSSTFILQRPFGEESVLTGNPVNVKHMLETKFGVYQKGEIFRDTLSDLFGDGMFISDGNKWKSQRQTMSHAFDSEAFFHYYQDLVSTELKDHLIPLFSSASVNTTRLDLQDILERFDLDTICQVACGYDAISLIPSLPNSEIKEAFHDSLRIINQRLSELSPLIWKTKKLLNVGSEKQLRNGIVRIRNLIKETVTKKLEEYNKTNLLKSLDFLSLLIMSGQSDTIFLEDSVINFILAGLESTSAVLTWYFWLLSSNPDIEKKIVKEIKMSAESNNSNLVYMYASIYESMRLYPSVPVDSREAMQDDEFPDGTKVKKGSRVSYHNYAMGRSEILWGTDWPSFKPERWLARNEDTGKISLILRDSFSYPEFHAGPRACMGKDMAMWKMKSVAAGILKQFHVVSVEEGVEPNYISFFNSKMEGGFPVDIKERA